LVKLDIDEFAQIVAGRLHLARQLFEATDLVISDDIWLGADRPFDFSKILQRFQSHFSAHHDRAN
jgi:hypothetical protein